ncbi:6565_t:CDS:2, partial [Gigaspora margarita]
SNMDPGEIDQWCNVYFRHLTDEHIPLQNHDSLSSFFGQLFFTNTTISRFIINTFSNINTDISECLRDLFTCQVDKLSTFKTEAQLKNRINRFWEESEDLMLILQCDVTTVNAGCIKLAKFIIEQVQNEFSRKNPYHIKHVCIILHIQREQNYMSSFNFMCGWKQVTIETLTPQEKNLSIILNGSLADIIKNEYKFEDILKHELLWCLLCIKYPSTSKSVDHIKTLKTDIMKCPLLIECLKTRALEWIEENSSDDWQYKVASDKKLLYPYTSFSAALLAYLRLQVRNPIAKILFVLEKLSVTKSFILTNQTRRNQDLFPFLKTIFFDPKILNINYLPEPKPDHYVMPELVYDLKLPFSYYFMKKINDFKTAWGDELEKLRENPDNCDDDELSHYAFENAVQGFSENVKTSLPAINDQVFRDFSEWFFDDFVTVMVENDVDKKDSELLAKLVQLYIGKDKAFDPVLLHIYWWKHSNVISADLQLAQMCPSVINEFIRSEPQLDQWQHEVVKILSFSAKILKTNKLRSYQLLRICNDIVSSKLIPLPNIKEIIKLGLDSDEQNVLSKKFVDHVLGILEKNEQNLSLQRSFIMRCLDTIPLDSVVRQHIYNNIFSQKDPFPLMGSIITKIFWKEEDAINEPFLRILQDSKEILQASPRLKVINSALKNNNLDSSMASLCCDIIQKELFVEMNIPEMARYFRHAIQALLEKTFEPLKRISAIAFLKEFVYCMWYQTLQDDYTQPISFIGIMDVGKFDAENAFKELYSIGNKAPFQDFLRQLQNINAFRARIALIGLIISRLHTVRASREWDASENQAADFLKIVSAMNNLSTGYKQTIERILSNRQPLLHLDNTIDNINLFLKSVIAHIAALHASIPPDSTPLATYFHKIYACQNSFILTTVSDIESLILSAVVAGDTHVNVDISMEAIRCPGCKNNTIGGAKHRLEAGNRKLDNTPITGPIKSIDQTGYIGEQPNNSVDYSVRSMPPSSYRILHLIVHALIGSSAHSQATLNFLRKHNQTANNVEPYLTDPLYLYICEPSLHFWPPVISELEYLDDSFPDSLFVNQAFEAYKLPPTTPGSQRGPTPRKRPKSRFDML